MATVERLWDYLGGIAQIDDEIEEKLNFRICPILLSAYWTVGMTCRACAVFLLVAWKNSMMPF